VQKSSRRAYSSTSQEGGTANVTAAVGMEETDGRLRARRISLFTHTVMWMTGLICFAFLVGTLAQAWSNSQLMQDLQTAKAHLQQLQAHNQYLKQLEKKYQDPNVIEREARQQLGYIRPGEHPVVVVGTQDRNQQSTQAHKPAERSQGFWSDWWNTFFGD
jgi:cell division protein FtsB